MTVGWILDRLLDRPRLAGTIASTLGVSSTIEVGLITVQAWRSGASVARQLGHSSPRVTLDVYSHLFPSELDSIAQRLDQVRLEALAAHARHESGSEPRGGDPR
jgi:integrase